MEKITLNDFDECFRNHNGILWETKNVHIYLTHFYRYEQYENIEDILDKVDIKLLEENEILEFIESSKQVIRQGLLDNLFPIYYKDDFSSVDEFLQFLVPSSVYIKERKGVKAKLYLTWDNGTFTPKTYKNQPLFGKLSFLAVLLEDDTFEYFDNNGREPIIRKCR